jgi:carboxymethylenebutenolidase
MSEQMSQAAMRGGAEYYVAKPKSGRGRPVLVLHAWWGLNAFIKGFCDRLANEGFVVLAPDLYHGAVASTVEEAEKLGSATDARFEEVRKEIIQAAEHLLAISGTNAREIGAVAFSLGGYYVLSLAGQPAVPLAAIVLFYATGEFDYAPSRAAFQFHLAETDVYEPIANVEKTQQSLAAAGRPAEFYTYPGTTHWFFESDRPDAYDAEAAQLAWDRTVAFLKAHLKET